MYWLKGCPKCGGDLHGDRDTHGAYVACLQCGHYLTPEQELALESFRVEGGLEIEMARSVANSPAPATSAA